VPVTNVIGDCPTMRPADRIGQTRHGCRGGDRSCHGHPATCRQLGNSDRGVAVAARRPKRRRPKLVFVAGRARCGVIVAEQVANQPRGGSDGQRQRKREGEKSEHTNLEGHSCNYRAEKGPGHWRENTNRYDYPGVQRRHLAGRIADSRRLPPHRLSRVKPAVDAR
jgi:hypothetical protein